MFGHRFFQIEESKCAIIYSANEKTRTETVKLVKFLKEVYQISSIVITDKICLTDVPYNISRTKYMNIGILELISIFRRFFVSLITHLGSTGNYFLDLLMILRYTLNTREEIFSKRLFSYYKPRFIFNFFPATTLGMELNKRALLNGCTVISYSWGSNFKALEQKYTRQTYLFIKNDSEKNKYPKYCYKKQFVVGDLGLNLIPSEGNPFMGRKFVLFIDTPYSALFGKNEKLHLYQEIFSNLPVNTFVVFKWHPASINRNEIKSLVNRYLDKVTYASSEYKLESLIATSSLVININSTIISTCIFNKKAVVNLFPLFSSRYLTGSNSWFEFMNATPCVDISTINQFKVVSSQLEEGIFPKYSEEELMVYSEKYFPFTNEGCLERIRKILTEETPEFPKLLC
jgi:hypothetical protein